MVGFKFSKFTYTKSLYKLLCFLSPRVYQVFMLKILESKLSISLKSCVTIIIVFLDIIANYLKIFSVLSATINKHNCNKTFLIVFSFLLLCIDYRYVIVYYNLKKTQFLKFIYKNSLTSHCFFDTIELSQF